MIGPGAHDEFRLVILARSPSTRNSNDLPLCALHRRRPRPRSRAFAADFALESKDISGGKFARAEFLSEPSGFGCAGGNLSPAFSWRGAPEGTKSFVLTIHDQDVPTGIGWMHWVVASIPGDARELPGGIKSDGAGLPSGAAQTRTDFGTPGYGGPCPPQGESHKYVVTLTALKIDKLPAAVTPDATPALVGYFANANALDKAALTITQGR